MDGDKVNGNKTSNGEAKDVKRVESGSTGGGGGDECVVESVDMFPGKVRFVAKVVEPIEPRFCDDEREEERKRDVVKGVFVDVEVNTTKTTC